jgi:hypothetical protein
MMIIPNDKFFGGLKKLQHRSGLVEMESGFLLVQIDYMEGSAIRILLMIAHTILNLGIYCGKLGTVENLGQLWGT